MRESMRVKMWRGKIQLRMLADWCANCLVDELGKMCGLTVRCLLLFKKKLGTSEIARWDFDV